MNRIRRIISWFANTSLARSLRFRLISIVLIASLPTLALLFLTASQARDSAITSAQNEAGRIALVTANEQAREMDRIQRELELLSLLPEVQYGNADDCTNFFQSLVQTPDTQIYVDLRVMGPGGKVYCRSAVSNPLGPNEDRVFIDYAIQHQTFTIGNYRINPLNKRSIISFAAPITNDDGTVDRAIVATLDLGSQSTALNRSSLPEGSIITIVESDGTLLLQNPVSSESRVGASLIGTPAVDATIGIVPKGANRGEMMDSNEYIAASSLIEVRAPQPGGAPAYVLVEIPRAEIVRQANTVFRDNLAKLAVAASIVVVAAWISADLFIARDAETRKTIVADWYHSFSSGVVDHLDTIVNDNVVDHAAIGGQAKGLDGIKQNIAAFRHAFPDGEVVPREMISEKDKVMVRVSLTGTQVSEFQGIPASGKRMIADGIETFAFRDGLISETWSLMGPLLEMKQVEKPELVEVEQQPRKRSVWQRIRRRMGRRQREDSDT